MKNNYTFGYIRVSSKDQNEERQYKKMIDLGIEERHIYIDKQSGKDFNRPKYRSLKDAIREGDLIYMDALDRLGRNYDGIISEWKLITRELNADIIILENESLFDSRKFKAMGDMGKLMEDQFLSLLAYVAEQERNKIRTRQAEGIAIAKANGKHLGRPPMNLHALTEKQKQILEKLWPQWAKEESKREITASEFMAKLNLKRNTFYKIIKEYEVNSSNKNLKSLANGIVRDFVAVKNSIISDYSNGFLEGNNNRLKMIKRTMYGRAGLDLLRAKIIH